MIELGTIRGDSRAIRYGESSHYAAHRGRSSKVRMVSLVALFTDKILYETALS